MEKMLEFATVLSTPCPYHIVIYHIIHTNLAIKTRDIIIIVYKGTKRLVFSMPPICMGANILACMCMWRRCNDSVYSNCTGSYSHLSCSDD